MTKTDRAPAPATDKPLTISDLPLLKAGDVLSHEGSEAVVGRYASTSIGYLQAAVSQGCIITFVRRPATSAASEGEVSKVDAIRAVDACGGTYSPDEERSGYADGHREALTAALSALAALASPPVSERERELEARVAELGAQIAWRTDDAPKDGSVIYGHVWSPYRWLPYKPNSEQAKRGAKGRWQTMNEYGGWENAPPPPEWATEDQIAARRALTAQPAGEGK